MNQLTRILAVLIAALCGACSTPLSRTDPQPQAPASAHTSASQPFGADPGSTTVGRLSNADIDELSGLAASTRHNGVFYAINDSGNAAEIFAIGLSGQTYGRWRLPVVNVDWEAISAFRFRGRHWLMIADVGDNLRRRTSYALHLIEEPEALDQLNTLPVHTHHLTFEAGAQNVESVAVSVRDRQVYFVAKAAKRPTLYSMALDQAFEARGIAQRRGRMASLRKAPAGNFLEMLLAARILLTPTSLDISANDELAVVGNYRNLYLYQRADGATWAEAFTGTRPQLIASHRLRQSESVAFTADGQSIVFSSEGRHAPVMLVPGSSVNTATAPEADSVPPADVTGANL
jgi:hypothetical protein